jgi:Tfp pilus assembly protein PilN
MIQLNLLPDIKLDFIKGQRMKHMVLTLSFLAIGISVGLLLVLLSLVAIQKKHVGDLDKDIDGLITELEETPELNKILSVQSQLHSLPALYDARPAVDRLPTYLDQTTPVGVRISHIAADFSTSTLEITGRADSLELVNSYVDTLKFTKYTVGEDKNELQAFKDVVLINFGRDEQEANYTVSFVFDPTIFNITKDVKLAVPSLVTTRVSVPSADLFIIEPEETTEETQ